GRGGGGTECVVGGWGPEAAISAEMGSVRLAERVVRHDPPTREERDRLQAAVGDVLDEVERSVPVRDARTLVAVAGTATTVRAVDLDLPFYDPDRIHRTRLTVDAAERVLE